MIFEKKTTIEKKIKLGEFDIQDILRKHIISEYGHDWENAIYFLGQESVAPYMGQLDDEYEYYATFKLMNNVID